MLIYVSDICEAKSFTFPNLPPSRKVSSKIGDGSFSMSQSVKSFYQTEIAFPVIDAALNTMDERFKENELDIFQSLKDVTCPNTSKIIKIASIQKVSEAYDLDMEKIKGEIQIFQKMYKKYIDSLPEISTEITELRKRCNFLVEKGSLRYTYFHT
ncbi:hypothetical protein AVEN_84780-1 [Araneus ventricosus]|uniref:Uncharacterized protein n=1 Tax=Araneus ventricosus TaxID=182803 RepID=A0A4Y2U085_ARAVE|nr:hypothetical protein AVEN_84780-1 [Araneus ventricosus]